MLPSLPQSVVIKHDEDARDRARSTWCVELAEAVAYRIRRETHPIRPEGRDDSRRTKVRAAEQPQWFSCSFFARDSPAYGVAHTLTAERHKYS